MNLYNRKNVIRLGLFLCLFNAGCVDFGHYGPFLRKYKPVDNFENTFLKFNISRARESNTRISNKQFNTYYLLAIWSEPNSVEGVLHSLMPDEGYWVSRNKVIFPDFSEDGRDIRFYEDCDYRIPLSKGKVKYEFQIFIRNPKQNATLIKTIDLPPKHSIRLNIVPAELPYPNPKDWTQKIENENAPEIEIVATVEPNPDPDEDKICEIPKD